MCKRLFTSKKDKVKLSSLDLHFYLCFVLFFLDASKVFKWRKKIHLICTSIILFFVLCYLY